MQIRHRSERPNSRQPMHRDATLMLIHMSIHITHEDMMAPKEIMRAISHPPRW